MATEKRIIGKKTKKAICGDDDADNENLTLYGLVGESQFNDALLSSDKWYLSIPSCNRMSMSIIIGTFFICIFKFHL